MLVELTGRDVKDAKVVKVGKSTKSFSILHKQQHYYGKYDILGDLK